MVDACNQLFQKGIQPAHYNMRFVKPIDESILHEVGKQFEHVITIEDGTIVGGFGSACLEFFALHNYKPSVTMLGIPDRLVEHGKPAELHRECNYDAQAVVETVEVLLQATVMA